MSVVYNEMLAKKKQAERMAQRGQNKYEYDSDEDVEVRYWLVRAQCGYWGVNAFLLTFIFVLNLHKFSI